MVKQYINGSYPKIYNYSMYDHVEITRDVIDQMWCYFCLYDSEYALTDPPDRKHFENRFNTESKSYINDKYISLFNSLFRPSFVDFVKSGKDTILKFILSSNRDNVYMIRHVLLGHYRSEWAETYSEIIDKIRDNLLKENVYGKWMTTELFTY